MKYRTDGKDVSICSKFRHFEQMEKVVARGAGSLSALRLRQKTEDTVKMIKRDVKRTPSSSEYDAVHLLCTSKLLLTSFETVCSKTEAHSLHQTSI